MGWFVSRLMWQGEKIGVFGNSDRRDIYDQVRSWVILEQTVRDIPAVSPFAQTGAVECMRAGYSDEARHCRVHAF